LAEELSEERLLVALETLELAAAAGRAQRQHNLERKTRLAQDEQLKLRVLRRHAACLEPLRRFEAAAEAVDELWTSAAVDASGWSTGGEVPPARDGGGTT
jgi:hypothetical protein